DREVLSAWRQSGAKRPPQKPSSELPYDTDPVYMKMLSRAEIQTDRPHATKPPL
ncbi:hypothetical protein L9F63_026197, partial [Diploptera punctata]